MKSKKIIAMIVAFAAFMAVATSGLAAVTTTTEYNLTDPSKVSVDVTVNSAAAGSEVTYLVEAGKDNIVYIDQQTADEDGKAFFNYKIAKDKLVNNGYAATVMFGTDGTAFNWEGNDFAFAAVDTNTDNANVTIKFYDNAGCSDGELENPRVGTKDEIYAKIFYDSENYTIKSVAGLISTGTANVYKVDKSNLENISVETEKVEKEPTADVVLESEPTIDVENPNKPTTDNNGNELDYDSGVVVKFIKVQNLTANSKVVVSCPDPEGGSEPWVFPVVTDGFTAEQLSSVTHYAVRFVKGDSNYDLSSATFTADVE